MEILNFERKTGFEKVSLASMAKDMEERIAAILADKVEISKEEYIGYVASILFSKFGSGRREDSYPEYLACEGVAMAVAVRALPNGRFEPFMEKFFREEIRSAINGLEDEARN